MVRERTLAEYREAMAADSNASFYEERRLNFLILALPDGHLGTGEIVSVSFREGIDFIDEDWPEFGNFLILETA